MIFLIVLKVVDTFSHIFLSIFTFQRLIVLYFFKKKTIFVQKTKDMILDIPDSIFATTPQYSPSELKIDIALWLYERKNISLPPAARLSGLSIIEFNKVLSERGIGIHYSENDLENDIQTLKKLFGDQ